MESDFEYYSRRAAEEYGLAGKAITDAGRKRHRQLAATFQSKADQSRPGRLSRA